MVCCTRDKVQRYGFVPPKQHGGSLLHTCSFIAAFFFLAPYPSCIAYAGTNGAVRLADGESGPGFEYGRLEVFSEGSWGSVCDRTGFTTASAQIACKSLGFDGGAPLRFFQPYLRQDLENQVSSSSVL